MNLSPVDSRLAKLDGNLPEGPGFTDCSHRNVVEAWFARQPSKRGKDLFSTVASRPEDRLMSYKTGPRNYVPLEGGTFRLTTTTTFIMPP